MTVTAVTDYNNIKSPNDPAPITQTEGAEGGYEAGREMHGPGGEVGGG
jgi:hypothetical protein